MSDEAILRIKIEDGGSSGGGGSGGGGTGGGTSALSKTSTTPPAKPDTKIDELIDKLLKGENKTESTGTGKGLFGKIRNLLEGPEDVVNPAEVASSLAEVGIDADIATLPAASSVAGLTAGLAPILGPAAIVVGIFAAAVYGAAEGLKKVKETANELAKKYETLSPDIASASATAELNQTLGDIRRAQTLGPDLAQFIEAQSSFEQRYQDSQLTLQRAQIQLATEGVKIQEALLPLLELGNNILANVLADITTILKVVNALLGNQNASTNAAADALNNFNPLLDFDMPQP